MSTKVINFGCRLNSFETEIIKQKAKEAGLDQCGQEVIIFNSCAVTREALRQTRQSIRKAARENKNAKIIVTGCGAQTNTTDFSTMSEVDYVIGNSNKLETSTYTNIKNSFNLNNYEKVIVDDIMSIKENAPHMVDAIAQNARSYVQVQNGCNHNCTFCIIPFGRGKSRSVPIGAVIDQISRLFDKGLFEIVLTGVDLTSYGDDLPGKPCLATLIKDILTFVPNLKRLRLSSIDSIEVNNELFDLLAHEKRIMPHLHLSLQSGNNLILKRMKRRHSREDAILFCTKLLKKRPEMVFGADLIAGFPTETDEMFESTKNLINECNLTFLHVFPFSAHKIVPASRMPQVEKNIIKKRASILRQKGQEALLKHLKSKVGSIEEILVESTKLGRTADYCTVKLNDDKKYIPGSIITYKIKNYNDNFLII